VSWQLSTSLELSTWLAVQLPAAYSASHARRRTLICWARLFGRHAGPLVEKLSNDFYADLPSIVAAIQSQGSFNLIHLGTMTKVDIFVRWRDPFAQSQFERRSRKAIGKPQPIDLFFASP
jgi:hypothetical protein